MSANLPVFIFAELLDHPLLLQLDENCTILLIRAIADVEGVGLAQDHVGLHKLSDCRAESTEVTVQDPETAVFLGLELRWHDGGFWIERATKKRREKV